MEPSPSRGSDLRSQLREAFRSAVSGEQRFGLREDARPELDKRWDRVIDLIVNMVKS